ncbi:hypothetical protein E2562_000282 [Oryza meyeriana var. granulata]|uniref:Uncharacterized protein n=1 Tax=Oryza meyeriana var. granulata TaxID=110450 RepID=A0A6G1CMU9_9ORYZ|nr:hypothetical protein E2562_000282 [Oryza meyeriana var. granulata]
MSLIFPAPGQPVPPHRVQATGKPPEQPHARYPDPGQSLPTEAAGQPVPADAAGQPLPAEAARPPLSAEAAVYLLPTLQACCSEAAGQPLPAKVAWPPLQANAPEQPLPAEAAGQPLPTEATDVHPLPLLPCFLLGKLTLDGDSLGDSERCPDAGVERVEALKNVLTVML